MKRHVWESGAVVYLLIALTAGNGAGQELEESLTTSTGAPLKVIVRQASAIRATADEQAPGQPVDVFAWYYAMPAQQGTEQKLANGFYHVSPTGRKSDIAGWLQSQVCVEWPHAQVVGFRSPTGRQRLNFYESREALEAAYTGKGTSPDPIAREPVAVENTLMPLLDLCTIVVDGVPVPAYRLAFLQRRIGPSSQPLFAQSSGSDGGSVSDGVTRQSVQASFSLDLFFCLDTSNSMQNEIDGAKSVIATIVKEIGSDPALANRVRFGAVAYRDVIAGQGIEYLTKMVCDLETGKDHPEFLRRLGEVQEANVGSEDAEEDVLSGLDLAIREGGWSQNAYKAILLVGDASAHLEQAGPKNPNRLTIEGILAAAQRTGASPLDSIPIHALRIKSAFELDHERCREHFEILSHGRDRAGIHREFDRADNSKFVAELLATIKTMTRITTNVAQGNFNVIEEQGQRAVPGSDEAKLLAPVLELIRSTDAGSAEGISFASGYACSIDLEGNAALEPRVMVTRGRLDLFGAALDFISKTLENAGEPGTKDVGKIVKSLQILSVQVNMAEDVDPGMPLAKLLGLVGGFPIRNAVLALTPARLAAMSQTDFAAWLDQVRGVQASINAHLDNPNIWRHLGGNGGRDQDRISFIKTTDLP